MKKPLSILALFLFFFTMSAVAQTCVVKGHVAASSDRLVRIVAYADQFSHWEETLASARTSSDGTFTLQLPVTKCTYAFFALDLKKSELYLSPGSTYVLSIAKDTLASKGSIFDRDAHPLPITILSAGDSLNTWISAFNRMYDHFVYNHFNAIYKWHDRAVISNFKKTVNNAFPQDVPAYFSQYVDYTMASLLWISRRGSKQQMLNDWFIKKPVRYNNIAYTDFFHEFFKGYFDSPIGKGVDYEKIMSLINNNPTYPALDQLIKKDTLLSKNNRVRELVEMELLESCFYNKEFDRDNVLKLYADLASQSKFRRNSTVALNFLKRFNHLAYGSPAPEIHLPDMMGNERSLDEMKGKFVLLTFLNTHCKICNYQLKAIEKINRRFNERLSVVSILSGNNPKATVAYFVKNGFHWPLLLLGKEITLLEKYEVRAFPAYVLINPDGTIALSPAPMPNENLAAILQRMIKRFDEKK